MQAVVAPAAAAHGLQGLQGFAAAHGWHGLAAAHGLQGSAILVAALGLQGPQGLAAAQGLQGLQATRRTSRGMASGLTAATTAEAAPAGRT